jgi:methylated-DNA-protein-cysteine methyltransferase-like protein
MPSPAYKRIYATVSRIPRGRVATYGQVAQLARIPGQARQVGYALSALSGDSSIPWHRVINARGEVSRRSNPTFEAIQRQLLEREGVAFDADSRVPLSRFRWRPRNAGSFASAADA